jgi:hypothetical protein
MPLGPRDVRTASATERAAAMLAWRTSSRRLVSVKVSVLDEGAARATRGADTTAAIDGEVQNPRENSRKEGRDRSQGVVVEGIRRVDSE